MKSIAAALCMLTAIPFAAQAGMFDDDPVPLAHAPEAGYETAFTPEDSVAKTVTKAIASAKKTIRVSSHFFVSKPLSEALIEAGRAGVDIQVVLDEKTNATGYSAAKFLQNMSLHPHVSKTGVNLYETYILIDDSDIVLGDFASIPGTEEESAGRANVLVIHNAPELVKRYFASWQKIWDESAEMKKTN